MRNKVKSEEDTLERAAKKRATNKQVDSTYLVMMIKLTLRDIILDRNLFIGEHTTLKTRSKN